MDTPAPEQTTGKTMLETKAPTSTDAGAIPMPVDDRTATDAVIESTSVQGAPQHE